MKNDLTKLPGHVQELIILAPVAIRRLWPKRKDPYARQQLRLWIRDFKLVKFL
jgi:hypothetical protein